MRLRVLVLIHADHIRVPKASHHAGRDKYRLAEACRGVSCSGLYLLYRREL